jgi:hypothetical protein
MDIMDDMKIAPVGSTISYDEFSKVDVRVGTIERVEDIPKMAILSSPSRPSIRSKRNTAQSFLKDGGQT